MTPTGIIDIFDFDRCTGQLSNWDTLGIASLDYPGPDNYYGCSFSSDGTKVYVSEGAEPPLLHRLFQWDLTVPDIRGSKTLLFTAADSIIFGQHQLGPDGKIYITQRQPWALANPANYALSVINDPNQAGLACNFSYLGLPLKGLRTTYSLPNLPNFNLPPMVAQVAEAGPQPATICPGDSVHIGYPDSTGGVVAYRWWPTVGVADSAAAYTWAAPDTTTMYYLTALDLGMGAPCGETVDSVLVVVVASSELPVASLGGDTMVCAGDSVSLQGPSAPVGTTWQYAWSTGDTTAQVMAPAGTYSVTVTNPAGSLHCFVDSDTITVIAFPSPPQLPVGIAGRDTVVCMGDTVLLGAAAVAGWDYLWSPASFLSSATVAQPLATPATAGSVNWSVRARDGVSGGACLEVLDTVVVTVEQPFAHAAPEGVTFCVGECFMLGVPPVAGYTYRWSPAAGGGLASPNSSLTRAQPSATTVYTLTVTDTAAQSSNCRERVFWVEATADGCNHPSFLGGVSGLLDLGDHAGRVELRVWDVAGRYVHGDDDYANDWDMGELAHGMYIYSVTVNGECPSSFLGKILVVR